MKLTLREEERVAKQNCLLLVLFHVRLSNHVPAHTCAWEGRFQCKIKTMAGQELHDPRSPWACAMKRAVCGCENTDSTRILSPFAGINIFMCFYFTLLYVSKHAGRFLLPTCLCVKSSPGCRISSPSDTR